MNDNRLRAPEWRRLVGEFFAPRLGGSAEKWSEANGLLAEGVWQRAMLEQARLGLVDTYEAWSRYYQTEWLRAMAGHVGVELPRDEDDLLGLAVEAAKFATLNCRSAYPDAPGAVTALAEAGFALNTASGEDSSDLDGYLSSMGVRHYFGHLFGPDLVNAFKSTPVYYERAFKKAEVNPGVCLVVDDSPQVLKWAAEAGALTVLVDRQGRRPSGYDLPAISALDELLPLLEQMEVA